MLSRDLEVMDGKASLLWYNILTAKKYAVERSTMKEMIRSADESLVLTTTAGYIAILAMMYTSFYAGEFFLLQDEGTKKWLCYGICLISTLAFLGLTRELMNSFRQGLQDAELEEERVEEKKMKYEEIEDGLFNERYDEYGLTRTSISLAENDDEKDAIH